MEFDKIEIGKRCVFRREGTRYHVRSAVVLHKWLMSTDDGSILEAVAVRYQGQVRLIEASQIASQPEDKS